MEETPAQESGGIRRLPIGAHIPPWRAVARGIPIGLATIAFGLLGLVAPSGGLMWAPIALAALLIVVNGLGYAELAAKFPEAGGAYALVHRSEVSGALPFLTGWALVFSAVGVCAVLALAGARYAAVLLSSVAGITIPSGALASAVVILVSLGKLLLRPRRWRGTAAALYLLGFALFIVLAVPLVHLENLRAGTIDLSTTLPPLVAAFVGLELVTTFQRGRGARGRRLAGAVLSAPVVVSLVATLVAMVTVGVLGPATAALSATPLALAGGEGAGRWGTLTILVLVAVAVVPALSKALSLVVRLLFSMSRDGFLPSWLGRVNYRRRTPLPATIVAGLVVLPVVWLPDESTCRVAGMLYLVALVSVNAALAFRRRGSSRSAGQTTSRFELPVHPWIPALAIAVDLLAISLWGLRSAAISMGLLAVGGLVYLVYGRAHLGRAREGVTVFKTDSLEQQEYECSILVPIANPATAEALLQFAGVLAIERAGEVVALRVEVVPEPLPLERGRRRGQAGHTLLDEAISLANRHDWPIRTVTRVARSVEEGILAAASDEHVDLIVTGWRGPVRGRETSLGPILDGVLRDAPCRVLMLRGESVSIAKRILVPSAGGPHALAAATLALSLAEARDGEVTLLSVHRGPASDEQTADRLKRLEETIRELVPSSRVTPSVVSAPTIAEGIIQEASLHDLVLLGVSEESLLDRLVFGSVPLQVAARVPATGLVQESRGVTSIWTRRLVRGLSAAFPPLDQREQTGLRQDLLRGARPGTNFLVLIVLSSVIATLGLLLDSPAVVIGAMLIAPLMSPLMAFAMGLVLGDLRMLRLSAEAILKGIAVGLLVALFIGLVSPLKGMTSEMLARSRPTVLDMAVALASGVAGAYALSRKDVSSALPGVALAASLMPPLVAVGLAISMGQPRIAGGALLLFIANIAAISLSAGVVFLLLGVHPQAWAPDSRKHLRRRLIASTVMVLAIAVPLTLIFVGIVRDARQERTAETVLLTHLSEVDAELIGLEGDEQDEEVHIVVTVRSSQTLGPEWADEVAADMADAIGQMVTLDVVALPVLRSTAP